MTKEADPLLKKVPALPFIKSFRLSPKDALAWDKKVRDSGQTHSEFFREAIISNKTTVVQKIKISKISQDVLYQISKNGNNINQIARSLNSAKTDGSISNETFKQYLSELEDINRSIAKILEVL